MVYRGRDGRPAVILRYHTMRVQIAPWVYMFVSQMETLSRRATDRVNEEIRGDGIHGILSKNVYPAAFLGLLVDSLDLQHFLSMSDLC